MTSPVNNKMKISVTGLLSPSSPVSPPQSSSAWISSATFSATFANIQQDEVEVPEYLNSIETYELIGFNHNVAYDMWSRYITADPDSPYHFMGYARA